MKIKKSRLILRLFFALLGIVGMAFYIAPLTMRSNVNIGTVTGIVIFGIIFLYGLFKHCIDRFLSRIWKKKTGKIILSFILVVIAGIIMSAGFLTCLMVSAINSKPDKDVTVVVLGCAVLPSGKPSLMLRERLDAAYEYLAANPDADCILCGGKGDDEVISEAECMYNYLVDKGIDSDRLYMEDTSTSTRENIEGADRIIQENNLNRSIAIVTNEFHEYRAQRIAKNLELDSYSVPGHTAWWLMPTYYVRELYGILYEMIF